MNWIIKNTKKLKYHTNLQVLFEPIIADLKQLEWLITDIDFMTDDDIPINFEHDWFLLNDNEFLKLVNSRTQLIWGVIAGIPKSCNFQIDEDKLPFADGHGAVWEDKNMQIEEAIVEVIAWDSSYTIVKFREDNLSEKFKSFFPEAIKLEKYKWK